MDTCHQLVSIGLFSKLSKETCDEIERLGRVLKVKKGTHLLDYREASEFVYFQLSGKSIQYVLTHHGKRKILFVLGQGALLNDYLFNHRTSSIYCETIENSEIFAISMEDMTKMMAKDFTLTQQLLMAQEIKFGRLSHQLKNTASSISMEKKLLAKLWKLSKDFGIDTFEGREIDMNLSITFLADMLGAPRETTSRLCTNLVEAKLIKINKKRFTLLNPEKLAQNYKNENCKNKNNG